MLIPAHSSKEFDSGQFGIASRSACLRAHQLPFQLQPEKIGFGHYTLVYTVLTIGEIFVVRAQGLSVKVPQSGCPCRSPVCSADPGNNVPVLKLLANLIAPDVGRRYINPPLTFACSLEHLAQIRVFFRALPIRNGRIPPGPHIFRLQKEPRVWLKPRLRPLARRRLCPALRYLYEGIVLDRL